MSHIPDHRFNRVYNPFVGYGGVYSYPPAHFNNNLTHVAFHRRATSPWEQNRSGYTSASPPRTFSSPNSPRSRRYASPPTDLRGNTLMSNLLQANRSGFSSNNDLAHRSNDNFNIQPSAPYTNNLVSDNSINAIRQNRVEPNFVDHFGPLTRSAFEMTSSPPPILMPIRSSSTSPIGSTAQLACEIHCDVQPLWCQTCSRTICGECNIDVHCTHVTGLLSEALEGASTRANKVIGEARGGMMVLREELDNVQLAVEDLDEKARSASVELMGRFREIVEALEHREKELLSRIENARLAKFTSLKAKEEVLRNGIFRLSRTIDRLGSALDASTITSNPYDLLVSKDIASAQIFQVQQICRNLPPAEESWISFSASEGNIMFAIANFGSIVLNNPGLIGDRRVVRGRGVSPPSFTQRAQMALRTSVARGRAIAMNGFPINISTPFPFSRTVKMVGSSADNRDSLCRPWGVACDKDGHIVVADRSNNRIQIYKEDGRFVRQFGSLGSAPGQFDRPAGIAVDARKRIVVADKDNHRIQILTMEGIFLLAFGEKGCYYGQFNYPWDVATNTECQIVVSDTRNHRVQLFSAEGVFLRKYGYEMTPSMWKHFDSPRGVAFTPEGNVVTTDFNNHRVVVIESDFLSAKVLDCNGKGGVKQILRPQGVIVDDMGNIIISDSRNHRIQVFDSAGSLLWKFGTHGNGLHEMDRPSGIALTPSGKVAVVDFGNNRVILI